MHGEGSHCGSGGRMAKFMVVISYREGLVLCEQYDKLDGHYFKDLVERETCLKKQTKGTASFGFKTEIRAKTALWHIAPG